MLITWNCSSRCWRKNTSKSNTSSRRSMFVKLRAGRKKSDETDHSGGRVRHTSLSVDTEQAQAAVAGGGQADDGTRAGQHRYGGGDRPRVYRDEREIRDALRRLGQC